MANPKGILAICGRAPDDHADVIVETNGHKYRTAERTWYRAARQGPWRDTRAAAERDAQVMLQVMEIAL